MGTWRSGVEAWPWFLDSVVHVKPETRTRPDAVLSFEVVLATASRSNTSTVAVMAV